MEKYRTFLPRLLALIINTLIFVPLSVLDGMIKEAGLLPVILSVWVLLFSLAHPVYSILMHGFYGQTLGKMALKIRVVDVFENPITFQHAILREVPNIFLNFSLIFFTMSHFSGVLNFSDQLRSSAETIVIVFWICWAIGDIAVFFVNDKRRSLHDFIAGTVVIRTNV